MRIGNELDGGPNRTGFVGFFVHKSNEMHTLASFRSTAQLSPQAEDTANQITLVISPKNFMWHELAAEPHMYAVPHITSVKERPDIHEKHVGC